MWEDINRFRFMPLGSSWAFTTTRWHFIGWRAKCRVQMLYVIYHISKELLAEWQTQLIHTIEGHQIIEWQTGRKRNRKFTKTNNKLRMIIHSSFYFLLLCYLTSYIVVTSDFAVLFKLLMGGPWPVTLWLRYFPQCVNVAKELPVTEQRQKSGRELPASSHTVAGQKGVKILLL